MAWELVVQETSGGLPIGAGRSRSPGGTRRAGQMVGIGLEGDQEAGPTG